MKLLPAISWTLFLLISLAFGCKSGKPNQPATNSQKEVSEPEKYPLLAQEVPCGPFDSLPDFREFELYNKTHHIRVIRYSRDQSFQRQLSPIDSLLKDLDAGNMKFEPGSETILTPAAREKLFRIALGFKPGTLLYSFCYLPRHLVIFEDKFHNRLAHLELCFQCFSLETDHPELEIVCASQWQAYAELFTHLGIAP